MSTLSSIIYVILLIFGGFSVFSKLRDDLPLVIIAISQGIFYIVIIYRSYLNLKFRQQDKECLMNKKVFLFLKYNIEFFILGLAIIVSYAYTFSASHYDFSFYALVLYVGGLISIPMMQVAASNSLLLSRTICVIFIYLCIPLGLLAVTLEIESYHEIFQGMSLPILLGVVVYRSYLSLKFKEW